MSDFHSLTQAQLIEEMLRIAGLPTSFEAKDIYPDVLDYIIEHNRTLLRTMREIYVLRETERLMKSMEAAGSPPLASHVAFVKATSILQSLFGFLRATTRQEFEEALMRLKFFSGPSDRSLYNLRPNLAMKWQKDRASRDERLESALPAHMRADAPPAPEFGRGLQPLLEAQQAMNEKEEQK
jgi:hypothetical protein